LHRGPLEYHYVLTKFHEYLRHGSKVISGGQTASHFGTIEVTFNAIITIQNFIQIHQMVQVIKVFLYTHLRSLNVRHFGMAEATRLKM
jgi:hypothetical protein